MKIMLLSDGHIQSQRPRSRRDNPIQTASDKLDFINYVAKGRGINTLLQAGDLTHGPKNWDTLWLLLRWLKNAQMNVYCIPGQHDMEYRSLEKTTMKFLSDVSLVNILGPDPKLLIDDIFVYGCPYGDEIPIPAKSNKPFKILVIHKNITHSSVPYEYTDAFGFLKKHKGYDLILCGDIHKKFIVEDNGRFIVNTGPLFRRSIDELENKPYIFLFDTKKREIEEIEIPTKDNSEILDVVFEDPEKNKELIIDIGGIDKKKIDFKEVLLDASKEEQKLYDYFHSFFIKGA